VNDHDTSGRTATGQRSAAHVPPPASNPPPGPVVELRAVAKRYRVGEVTVTALDGISLRVHPGEFVVILGASGSGKTTMLNLIGALDAPTEGTIRLAGRDITAASRRELFAVRRRTVGFIFQSFNLFPGLTALENVEFGVDTAGAGDAHRRARETLDTVGLGDRLRHFPHELSGGEQQRVAIARALATGNPILLADEPTGELDFHTGVQILQLLHERTHTDGTAVIVVTHNSEIARTADRVIELSSGRIVSDGPPPGGPVDIADLRW
jgi:putative ABC transport system ATP-binding protein